MPDIFLLYFDLHTATWSRANLWNLGEIAFLQTQPKCVSDSVHNGLGTNCCRSTPHTQHCFSRTHRHMQHTLTSFHKFLSRSKSTTAWEPFGKKYPTHLKLLFMHTHAHTAHSYIFHLITRTTITFCGNEWFRSGNKVKNKGVLCAVLPLSSIPVTRVSNGKGGWADLIL